MKRGTAFLALIGVIFFAHFASAEILLDQISNVYNIQDELIINAVLKPSSPVNDFFDVKMVCGESLELYRGSFNLESGEEREVAINVVLSKSVIGSIIGLCHIEAEYGPDIITSQEFTISREINVDLDFNVKKFNPGEKISMSGKALKLNGEPVQGFIEVLIDDIELSISKSVSEGKFSFNFTLPQDSPAGQHVTKIRVYEKDKNEEVSNEKYLEEIIEIFQVMNELKVEFDQTNIDPGDNLNYKISAIDQSGALVEKDISVVIYEPGNFVHLKKVVKSGEENVVELGINQTPGYWKIEAGADDFIDKKLFYLEEKEEALFSLVNDTLIVTNIGNVPYKKAVEFSIGSGVEILDVELDVGQTKKFRLRAPEGEYVIGAKEGDEELVLGKTFLTGKAVDIGETRDGISLSWSGWIVVLVIILVVVVTILLAFVRRKKPETKASPISSLFEGEKEEAVAVALRLGEIKDFARSTINEVLLVAKKHGGSVYVDGDYRIMMFSSRLTKKSDNEIVAINAAKEIDKILKGYNAKYSDKIDYGLGINKGVIVSQIKDGKFKFTSTDNIISFAKRISDSAKEKVLMSDSVHRRVAGSVNSEKKEGNAWSVDKVADRDKHKVFTDKFRK